MKKIFLIFLFVVFVAAAISSQEEPSLYVTDSTYYKVYSEVSNNHASETAQKMDAFFNLFNSYFHFDPDSLDTKLQVRIFSSKERFNTYLEKIIDARKDNFVYLQYTDPAKSELVGFNQAEDAFTTSLIRHGFIQFIKSFIQNPPEWMLKGFAIYFEKSAYDEDQNKAVFKENLSWLNTLKTLIMEEQLLSPRQFLNPRSDVLTNRSQAYHAQAWGFVTFLRNTNKQEYNRILWDSISTLRPDGSKIENVVALNNGVFSWMNDFLLINEFKNYILSMKTFPDLVEEGIELYSLGNYEEAEETLLEAILLDGTHYLPYYYLGLIHYAREDFSLAEYYYQSARMLGADPALIHYAMGVNAFADGRYDNARDHLDQAKELNGAQYEEKADSLLERIEGMELKEGGQGM
jgi:tetratricopeptide (TPR) repeat protein